MILAARAEEDVDERNERIQVVPTDRAAVQRRQALANGFPRARAPAKMQSV
jgi:hypothetical protein